jgi:hypothetical protein
MYCPLCRRPETYRPWQPHGMLASRGRVGVVEVAMVGFWVLLACLIGEGLGSRGEGKGARACIFGSLQSAEKERDVGSGRTGEGGITRRGPTGQATNRAWV